jgi:hypothetical protein
MKFPIYLFAFILLSSFDAGPSYDAIGEFDIYRTNWALVEQDGLLGFINDKGEEVVSPQYESIDMFGIEKDGWAKVKKDGKVTFINSKGQEI